MIQPQLRHLAYALLLSFSAPVTVQAIDITLYPALHVAAVESSSTSFQLPASDLHASYPPLLEEQASDLWDRMRSGFRIPDLENSVTASRTKWYSAQPAHFERTLNRASRYLYHVVEELEKRDMPTELALLPFVESSFDPHAVSSAQAAGMWQFIPSTGKFFNLKQNFFRDERRDILASTDAALTYLQKLHDMFGDWHLALAAYNWGEGSVQRAINKAKAQRLPTDFNSLSRFMPEETKNYVPKLQAVKNIISEPQRYAVTLPPVENEPYFVTVRKIRDIDVKVAAQLAELSMDEFKALNPQFNRPVITGGPNTYILLPHANAEKFKSNIEKWERGLSSWALYTVKDSKEQVEAIAKRFNTTPEVLREVNNLPANVRIKSGSTLLVPRVGDIAEQSITREVADRAVLHYETLPPPERRMVVKVGQRDTLYAIAKRYNVTVSQIKGWNDLKVDRVLLGQTLELFLPNQSIARSSARSTASSVRPKASVVAKKSAPAKPAKSSTTVAKRQDNGRTVVAASSK